MNQNMTVPGWYRVNSDNHFRYFDGIRFEEDFEIFPVSSDVKYFLGPKQKPRAKALRILLLLAGWLAITLGILGVALIGGEGTNSQALDGLGRIVGLIVIGVICTNVGYRWFDTFLALIPFYGAFFIAKMLWRVSVLPHRYWTLRGEATPQVYDELKLVELSVDSSTLNLDNIPKSKELIKSRNLNKGVVISLVAVIVLVSSLVLLKSSGLVDSFRCKNLKNELASQDVIGRDLWNSYQREVSNLNNFVPNSGQYYSQVGNVSRRLIQVLNSDISGYQQILDNPKCASDIAFVSRKLQDSEYIIKFLKGEEVDSNGAKWSPYNGWNVDYYSIYADFSEFLK